MTRRVPLLVLLVLLTAVVAAAATASAQGMLDSKHNLSVSGPGPIRAVSETQICVFCHTPHNANPSAPLWNRQLSGQTYTPYASGSLQAAVGQPNGYSRLCLSCHDGSIAIGSVLNLGGHSATVQMQGTGPGGVMPAGSTLLGTNLTNDHPVSFVFDAGVASGDGELVTPSLLTGAIRLYEGATAGLRDSVQCTTCHDPHLTVNPKFLKRPFLGRTDNVCLTCHVKPGWPGSSHEAATAKFFPSGSSTSVADLSCGACHTPHTKPGAPRLLRNAATDAGAPAIQLACYRCHAPQAEGGITFDLKTQFEKTRRHPIGAYAGHEPIFTVASPTPEGVLNTAKHVECSDCHNPHRTRARGTTGTGGVFEGMRAIDLGGTVVQDVTQDRNILEFEVCFRCHGDSYGVVIGTLVQGDPSGTIPVSNKRLEFPTTNSSYHPVAGAGKNTSSNLNDQLSPNGLSTSSVIRCSDCHNNDYYSGPSFRGVVSQYPKDERYPKGPHGSNRFNLLRARAWNTLPGPSSFNSLNFDLCFHCHDVNRLTQRRRGDSPGARTNFYSTGSDENLHWLHLVDRVDKSGPVCKSCHYNVHSNAEASNTQYRVTTAGDCSTGTLTTDPESVPLSTTRLINFHPSIQRLPNRTGKPEWCFNTVTRERRCYLQCHQPNGNPGGVNMAGNSCSGLSDCKVARYTPAATGDIQ